MSDVLEIIVNGSDNASGMLGRVGGALGALGSAATRAGADLLPLSAAAGAVAISALALGANYEQGMDVLQASTGASVAEMQRLGDAAIALGADITLPGTSAADAAEAMLELSKAGLSVTDTLGAADGVLRLSAAAEIGNAEAATIAANALNMFGLAGSEASTVADLLAAGANKSSADIQQMAYALQMAGSVAAMAGLSIQDVTTAIALMANEGVKGSDAGTSLKTMLMALQGPSQQAADLMAALGISVYDAQGNMLPMPALIEQFGGALGGLTQQQRNAALATIFGNDAVRAANILLLGGTEAWNTMAGAVTQGGVAAEMAAAKNAGLLGALDALRSTVETRLLTATQSLVETLGGLVRGVTELIEQVATANPQLVTAGVVFSGVLAVMAPLALGIGALSTALGVLLGPVGLVIVAVGALAAAWATDFGGIREITGTVLAAVRSTVETVVSGVRDFVTANVGATRESWGGAWTAIQAIVESVLGVIRAAVGSVLDGVRGFIGAHGADITATLGSAWRSISEIVNLALTLLSTSVGNILGAVRGLVANHGDAIQTILSGAWTLIKTVITTALGMIQGTLTAVLQAAQGNWSGAWTAMRGVAATLWEGIKGIISGALTVILGLVGTNLEAVKAWFVSKFNEIKGFLGGIDLGAVGSAMIAGLVAGIRSMAGALVAAAKGVVQGAIDAAKALLGIHSPSTVFWEMGENTDEGYAGGVEEKKALVVAAVSTMAQAAVGAARELSAAFGDAGTSAVAMLAAGMQGEAPAVSEAATAVMAQATGAVSGALTLLNGLASEMRIPDVGAAVNRISRFLVTLVGNLGQWAEMLTGEAQERARTFAEAAGPVVGVYTDTLDLLKAFTEEARVPGVGEGINRVSRFLVTLVGNLAEWTAIVGEEAQGLAKEFAEQAKPVIGVYTDALGLLAKFAEETRVPGVGEGINRVSRFLITLVGNLAEWAQTVTWAAVAQAAAFARGASDVVGLFGEALQALAGAADLDIPSLVAVASEAGMAWITALTEGIASGVGQLQTVLNGIGGMLNGGLGGAQFGGPGLGAKEYASGLRSYGLDAGVAATHNSVTININNPVVREDADIDRLAQAVGDRLAAAAGMYLRTGYA